jgi:hypothetical protein
MEHPFIAHYGAMTDKPEADFQPDTSLPFPELDLLRLFRLAHIYYILPNKPKKHLLSVCHLVFQ